MNSMTIIKNINNSWSSGVILHSFTKITSRYWSACKLCDTTLGLLIYLTNLVCTVLTWLSLRGGRYLCCRAALTKYVIASTPHSRMRMCGCWQTSNKWLVSGLQSTSTRGRFTSPVSNSLATAKSEGSWRTIEFTYLIIKHFDSQTGIATQLCLPVGEAQLEQLFFKLWSFWWLIK